MNTQHTTYKAQSKMCNIKLNTYRNNPMDINQEIENLKVEHQNILKQYNIAHIFLNNTKHHQLQNVYVFLLLLLSLSTTGFVWWNFGYNWFLYLLGVKEINLAIISFSTMVNIAMLIIISIIVDLILECFIRLDNSDIISDDDIKKSMNKVIQEYYFKDNQVLLDDTYSQKIIEQMYNDDFLQSIKQHIENNNLLSYSFIYKKFETYKQKIKELEQKISEKEDYLEKLKKQKSAFNSLYR